MRHYSGAKIISYTNNTCYDLQYLQSYNIIAEYNVTIILFI